MAKDEPATEFDAEFDVLIVGAGGCGLVAAIAADAAGASVAVVEKQSRLSGNTALSSGSIPGAGTRLQAEVRIKDSPKRFAEDVLRVSGPHDAEHLAARLTALSAELVEWLIDEAHVSLTQGGLAVDTHAHVLRTDGTPIIGLFAGGGAATGISGRRGSDGYVSGNGLLSALGLGLIAGREAASHAADQRAASKTKLHHNVQQGEMT